VSVTRDPSAEQVGNARAACQPDYAALAEEVLARCDVLARYSEEPGKITRPFPSEAMRGVHTCVREWMQAAGLSVHLDAIGNLIGHYAGQHGDGRVFLIGSHLDSVPNAGKYDGVLGVLLGVAAVQALREEPLPFGLEIVGFCEEEGIRFRTPFLGSRALAGSFDRALLERRDDLGIALGEALQAFGLDPSRVNEAAYPADSVLGYLEPHIEQGPVLDNLQLPVGVVEGIASQSRSWLRFVGKAGHAGTVPMDLRRDALAAAAEFVLAVEALAQSTKGLVATVGAIHVEPCAINVVPGSVHVSLDVRHPENTIRAQAHHTLLDNGAAIARRRGVECIYLGSEPCREWPADARLTALLAQAAASVGYAAPRMVSGAGHDAAVMASLAPMAMLFIRSPGGVSHHPDEAVRAEDVAVALEVMIAFLRQLGRGDAA
jgi:allantoate deiminase